MTCRYLVRRLMPDYLRAGAGLLACTVVLLVGDLPAITQWFAALLLLLFMCFAVMTAWRQRLRVTADDAGLTVNPGARRIAWTELRALELAYFSTRRDGRDGWMQLRLKSHDATLRLDSRLDGFEHIAKRAARAARSASLSLTPSTSANLAALGRSAVRYSAQARKAS